MKPWLKIFAIIGIGAITVAVVRARQAPSLERILARSTEVYAECQTYRDSGVVKTSFAFGNEGTMTLNGTFSTAFVRPDRFRYEFKGKMMIPARGELKSGVIHCIIWRNAKETYSFHSTNQKSTVESQSFEEAVSGGTGISGGLATMTADMLLPSDFQRPTLLTDLKEATRLGDAKVGAVECFRIQGKMFDRSTTVWIDKQTYLIRRMDWNEVVENTTVWEPTINAEIPAEALEFNAPQLQ